MQNTSCNAEYCFRTTTTISTHPLNYRVNLLPGASRSSRTTTARLERLVDEMKGRRADYSRISTRQDIRAPFRDMRISNNELIEGKVNYVSRNIVTGMRRRRADHEQIRDLTVRTDRNLGTNRERSDRFVSENRVMVRNERIRRDFQFYLAGQMRDLKPRIASDNEVFRKEPRLDVLRSLFATRRRVDRRQEPDFGRQTRDHHEDLGEFDEGTYSDFFEIREEYETNNNRRRDSVSSQGNGRNTRISKDTRRIFSEKLSLYSRLFPSNLEVMNCGMTILAAIFIYDFICELTQVSNLVVV